MTDLVEELRCLADDVHSRNGHNVLATAMSKAADEIVRLRAEVKHWKSNHATEVERAGILKERTDMPIERVQAYEKWGEVQKENERLTHAAVEEREACAALCEKSDRNRGGYFAHKIRNRDKTECEN